jgi:outer membrane protein assembly factor BamD (BamD/ComL family)
MARELHRHIVEQHPESDQAIWAQRNVVLCSAGLRDDPNIDAGIEKLLDDFGTHKEICTAVYQIARKLNYREGSRARQAYEYVRDRDSGGRFGMLAEVNLGKIELWAGDPNGARAIFDGVLERYRAHPRLAEGVNLIGEVYWNRAFSSLNAGSDEQYQANLHMAMGEFGRVFTELPETEYHTAAACFLSGECHRLLGELPEAIEKYDELYQRWPDFERAAYAQLRSARCLETLVRQRGPSKEELVSALQNACRRIIENYPDSDAVEPAGRLLRRWERRPIEEGRRQ